jgi:bifunctional DNA-binding transcriptional regulator/antitoxin component of YhaV-PrlF toxin-antitoxin module
MPDRLYITIEELQERIDDIVEEYNKGDDTEYIISHDGKEVMLTPFNGPWTETVIENDEGDLILPLPDRLCAKLGLEIGDDLEFDVTDDGVKMWKANPNVTEDD